MLKWSGNLITKALWANLAASNFSLITQYWLFIVIRTVHINKQLLPLKLSFIHVHAIVFYEFTQLLYFLLVLWQVIWRLIELGYWCSSMSFSEKWDDVIGTSSFCVLLFWLKFKASTRLIELFTRNILLWNPLILYSLNYFLYFL